MNIKNALKLANDEFIASNIDNYFYEVRQLMAFALNKSKEWIMANLEYEISDEEYIKFSELKKERIKGTPFQYILGEQYFMGFKFFVNPDVLIPRADTEILVYKTIDIAKEKENVKILDMCTGSGCIAISLAKLLKNPKIYAADISDRALLVAKKNSEVNDADIEFFCSDLFSNIPDEKFDIIVSNPPYITDEEMKELSKEVLKEPHLALNGGSDGLKFYRDISKKANEYLTDEGIIVFEIGCNQANSIIELLRELNYKEIEVIKDYSGNDRVVVAKK